MVFRVEKEYMQLLRSQIVDMKNWMGYKNKPIPMFVQDWLWEADILSKTNITQAIELYDVALDALQKEINR